ncbi:AAA family ATPase [Bacillus anthracis]|uniref:Endonuclease GajA/Old nuclease/RecF-like AAA domain-containing protein n=1 Tax=Bacillus anthracis TaxID=1392 RepID=A0A2A7D1N8_BACAN|nr:AAA family ATPase [Bacillus anthracis]PDZ13942.1 hypothetical protein CON16_27410 [Bacillus anthracis]
MEILYLWVEKYQEGTINKQGFNFSSQYRFQYNPSIGELNVQENPNYLSYFFNEGNQYDSSIGWIQNITAIIGENGTGKSTILEFIMDNLTIKDEDERKPASKEEIRSVIVLQNSVTMEKIVYHHEALEIKSGSYKEYELELIPYVNEENDGYWIRKTIVPKMKDTTFIFFSNIFDAKKVFNPFQKVINLSTNYLIRDDIGIRFKETSLSESLMHRYKEIERQIEFVFKSSLKYEFVHEIPVPTKVEIMLADEERKIWRKIENATDQLGSFFNWFSENFQNVVYDVPTRDSSSYSEFRLSFYFAMVQHLYMEILGASAKFREKIAEWLEETKTYYDNNFLHIQLMFTHLLNKLDEFIGRNNQDKTGNEKSVFNDAEIARTLIKNMYNALISMDECLQEGWAQEEDFDTITMKLKMEHQEKFLKFYGYYKESYRSHPYLNFDWLDLSSGQKAMLNLFARFYTTVNEESYKSINVNDNLIILIDEGELYFHPQWQKKFIQLLIRFLTKLYKGKRIQLILTSNSPFIISDLPSSNVIFLEKTPDGMEVIDGLENHQQTFASNIHTLLGHSFFMREGLIGSFAKEKINNIANLLINGSKKEVDDRKEEIEKVIQVIGEPLIKDQLLKELEVHAKVKLLTINDEIEFIKKQLSKLEGKKK